MILNYCSIGPSLSIQKRKSKKFLRTMGASISFFLLRGGGGYGLRRGFILAHYDIVITFCYLITIPKHINDMEDIVVTPNLMFIFCCFCVNFTFVFLLFSFIFHIFSDSIKCNLWKKKNREENKNQHKSVSWQPMVTCKHNMAHCSFAYVKRWVGSRRYS